MFLSCWNNKFLSLNLSQYTVKVGNNARIKDGGILVQIDVSGAGADPEFGKRGGTLLKKKLDKKKKKKVTTTIIASYPLPNISRMLYPIYSFIGKLHCLMNIVTVLLE